MIYDPDAGWVDGSCIRIKKYPLKERELSVKNKTNNNDSRKQGKNQLVSAESAHF